MIQKLFAAFLLATTLVCVIGSGIRDNSGSLAASPNPAEVAPVAVVPVVRVDAASDMVVEAVFENTTTAPLRYLATRNGTAALDLRLDLWKNRKLVQRETIRPLSIRPEQLKELAPGQGIPHVWKLWNMYGTLEPGRYEVTLVYETGGPNREKDFGITPLTFKQRMYLEIESKK